jgi:hypothetical protein
VLLCLHVSDSELRRVHDVLPSLSLPHLGGEYQGGLLCVSDKGGKLFLLLCQVGLIQNNHRQGSVMRKVAKW